MDRPLQPAPAPLATFRDPAAEPENRRPPAVVRQAAPQPTPALVAPTMPPTAAPPVSVPPGPAPPTKGSVQFAPAAPTDAAPAPAIVAQTTLPGGVAPPGELGRVDRPVQPLPPAPLATPSAPAAPAAPAAPSGSGPSFVLKDIVIEGSSVYPPDELKATVAKFIGQSVTFDAVPEIEETIARKYRGDGYILARALAPENQSLDPAEAVLRIVVFEGFIDKVRLDPLEYEVGERGERVRDILKQIERGCRPGDEPVGDKPCPLHRSVLERYLLLANDLPGVRASAVIQPATDATGGADLFVTITERLYQGFIKADNRGTVYSGPLRGDAGVSFNNLTDFYERTSLRIIAAKPLDELLLFDISESVPVSSEGTLLTFGFNRSQSRPGDILRSTDLKSKTLGSSLSLVHPVLRSRSENFFARVAFDYRNSRTQIGPAPQENLLFEDRTRAFSIGGTYDLADRFFGVNLVDLRWAHGAPILNASKRGEAVSRGGSALSEASGDFSKLNLEVSRLQRLLPEFNLLASAAGQYSFSNLVVSEQFGFGGDRYGRAYDPSEILGDHGLAAKLELQYNPAWLADAFNLVDLPPDILRAFQIYAYYDYGIVWQRARDEALAAVLVTAKDRDAGTAAGAGVRFNILDWLSGYVELAFPLTRDVQAERAKTEDGKHARVFFSLATQF